MSDSNKAQFKYDYEEGLLSSIIVTYNSGKYLYEAIDSILNQDYSRIELIISDDGTKDFDADSIRSYINNKKRDNITRITIIHREKNIGTVRNINNALSITHGEYIKLLGGDDSYPEKTTFSKQVNSIRKNGSIASIGMARQCNNVMQPIADERVDRSNADLPTVLKMDYKNARKYIAKRDIFPIAIQAVCYHRNFFLKKGFCDESYILIDDASSALMLLQEAKYVTYMDEYTVNHRAKVGISSSREFFAPRRLLYYKDCVTFAEKEIDSYPEIFGYVYRKENVRINKFVYEMAKAKFESRNKLYLAIIIIKYIDAIFYYILTNTRKFIKRIIERFS